MIVTFGELSAIREKHKGQKVVLATGTFDLFHAHHWLYLKQVPPHGDITVVMVNGDARVRAAKGHMRPVIPEHERANIIDALKGVDYVFVVPGNHKRGVVDPIYTKVFATLRPDVFVTANDEWAQFSEIMGDTQLVVLLQFGQGDSTSTTAIINRILNLTPDDK